MLVQLVDLNCLFDLCNINVLLHADVHVQYADVRLFIEIKFDDLVVHVFVNIKRKC